MKNTFLIILLFLLLSSCSKLDKKIELIENELNIELNNNYNVLENEFVQQAFLETDYKLILRIQLEENQILNILSQIKNEPYYNQLGKFKTENGEIRLAGIENINYFKRVEDSLRKTKYRGSWFQTDSGYEFIDIEKKSDAIDAKIILKERILEFEFIQM